MKKSTQLILVLVTLITTIACNDKAQSNKVEIRGGHVVLQKFDDEPIVSPLEYEEIELLKHYPSIKEVFHDYGNYWVNSNDTKSCLLFDFYSGKLSQFKNIKSVNNKENNNVFVFQIENYKPIKIVGEFGFRDGDTLMHWTFDEKRKVLINEKGVVFKQMKGKLF